jgi:A/G-specific adenine glycosylase
MNQEFSRILRDWYRKNGRNLPWRTTRDPYKIWLSEIILQQTRVDQGLPYYLRFIEAFPRIEQLAAAPEDEVLRLWQGLGYYSRARNLQSAAKQVVSEFNGQFPADFISIKSLKGIGDYTASAIASFAFDLPHPVLDGNVYRFLSRFAGIETPIDSTDGKKAFASLAAELFDPQHAAEHNQAMMEMGALVCKPANPNCDDCPFSMACHAYIYGKTADLPVKGKKTKVRKRYLHYFLLSHQGSFLIRKRSGKDIWTGLYELPLIETEQPISVPDPELRQLLPDIRYRQIGKMVHLRHLLSHQELQVRFWHLECTTMPHLAGYKVIPEQSAGEFGFPQLIIRYFREIGWG